MRTNKYVITALCLALLCLGAAGISSAAEPQTHENSIGMEFVLIPAGSFMMGDESQHKVTITRPFYLGKYEVTQEQWEAVMGSNPSEFKGPDNPVEKVSWDDVQVFIRKLNQKEGHNRYRLPTEAEWEYAARAGTSSAYSFGDDKNELSKYAWYDDMAVIVVSASTQPVGEKLPNPWGLHDVHGNVWEWVQDWYGERYYANSPVNDPKGPANGSDRVFRGGSRITYAENCRSGYRSYLTPDSRNDNIGFRLALLPE